MFEEQTVEMHVLIYTGKQQQNCTRQFMFEEQDGGNARVNLCLKTTTTKMHAPI